MRKKRNIIVEITINQPYVLIMLKMYLII